MKKSKKHNRKLGLLLMAEKDRLRFHMEGGMAMNNSDVKELVKDGLLVFKRKNYWTGYPLSSKKFEGKFLREVHGKSLHGHVNRTYGVLTDKGKEFLDNHRQDYTAVIEYHYQNTPKGWVKYHFDENYHLVWEK